MPGGLRREGDLLAKPPRGGCFTEDAERVGLAEGTHRVGREPARRRESLGRSTQRSSICPRTMTASPTRSVHRSTSTPRSSSGGLPVKVTSRLSPRASMRNCSRDSPSPPSGPAGSFAPGRWRTRRARGPPDPLSAPHRHRATPGTSATSPMRCGSAFDHATSNPSCCSARARPPPGSRQTGESSPLGRSSTRQASARRAPPRGPRPRPPSAVAIVLGRGGALVIDCDTLVPCSPSPWRSPSSRAWASCATGRAPCSRCRATTASRGRCPRG